MRHCRECGGIYLHYGMCSKLPAGSKAGQERDRKLADRSSREAQTDAHVPASPGTHGRALVEQP